MYAESVFWVGRNRRTGKWRWAKKVSGLPRAHWWRFEVSAPNEFEAMVRAKREYRLVKRRLNNLWGTKRAPLPDRAALLEAVAKGEFHALLAEQQANRYTLSGTPFPALRTALDWALARGVVTPSVPGQPEPGQVVKFSLTYEGMALLKEWRSEGADLKDGVLSSLSCTRYKSDEEHGHEQGRVH